MRIQKVCALKPFDIFNQPFGLARFIPITIRFSNSDRFEMRAILTRIAKTLQNSHITPPAMLHREVS